MKKMKKAALIFGTGLCLAVGTGGTLAYLGDTGQVANRLTFAGEKGLDAVLTEPSWNPQKGLLTVPGSSVAKDPQITNTSELNMNELAALKCEFVYSQNCPDKSKRGKVLSAQDMERGPVGQQPNHDQQRRRIRGIIAVGIDDRAGNQAGD